MRNLQNRYRYDTIVVMYYLQNCMDRRNFLWTFGAIWWSLLIWDAVWSTLKEWVRLNPSEIQENLLETHRLSLTSEKWYIFFYNKHWKVLKKVALPRDWDVYVKRAPKWTEQKKQAWRDEMRKSIWKEHGITEASEKNIFVTSPHGVLKWEEQWATFLSLTQEYGNKVTKGDARNRTRMQYVIDEFRNIFQDSPDASKLLSTYITWLAWGESRFNSDLESDSGAVWIFQLMPHIIHNEKINPRKYSVVDVRKSLKMQVELAKNLFLDNWKHLRLYTPKVAQQYFQWDTKKALECVIIPLLINAYNTGYKNVNNILKGFLDKYKDSDAIGNKYKISYPNGIGADLFYFISLYGKEEAGVASYWKDSALYYYKTVAMAQVIAKKGNKNIAEKSIAPSKKIASIQENVWISSMAILGWIHWLKSAIPPGWDNEVMSSFNRRDFVARVFALIGLSSLSNDVNAAKKAKESHNTSPKTTFVRQVEKVGNNFRLSDTTKTSWEINKVVPIASLTKLLSALVIYDICKERNINITKYSVPLTREHKELARKSLNKKVLIKNYTIEELLDMALIKSTNEATEALASGLVTRAAFIKKMNEKAQSLGMVRTHFDSPSGLSAGNVSTAADLERLVIAVLNSPYPIGKTTQYTSVEIPWVRWGELGSANRITIELLPDNFSLVMTKTWFIKESWRCEITVVKSPNGKIYTIIILGERTVQSRRQALFGAIRKLK